MNLAVLHDFARPDLQPGDAELVVRAKGGDRFAEELLYRRHSRAVFNLARRMLGSGQDAEDVLQETFLTVLEKLPRLREPGAFKTWVMRTAVRGVLARHR